MSRKLEGKVAGRDIEVGVHPGRTAPAHRDTPLGRFGTAEEAAGSVYMFCIPESNFVTGQTLICGGGPGGLLDAAPPPSTTSFSELIEGRNRHWQWRDQRRCTSNLIETHAAQPSSGRLPCALSRCPSLPTSLLRKVSAPREVCCAHRYTEARQNQCGRCGLWHGRDLYDTKWLSGPSIWPIATVTVVIPRG